MDWYYNNEIRIKKLQIPPYDNNCYMIACPQTNEAVILDAPGEPALILHEIADLHIRYIIITHTHPDHIGALEPLKKSLGVAVGVHSSEANDLLSPLNSSWKMDRK